MSRAYRIRVKESDSRIVRANDRISTQLELLEILPPEQMTSLLAQELKARGFAERDGLLQRNQDGITITVDPRNGEVTVLAEGAEKVTLEAEKESRGYDDYGPGQKEIRQELKEAAKKDIEVQAARKTSALQSSVTEHLEKSLCDIRDELDAAVNRATAEALKQKAAQIGTIKEMTEDAETGSLTIVLEV